MITRKYDGAFFSRPLRFFFSLLCKPLITIIIIVTSKLGKATVIQLQSHTKTTDDFVPFELSTFSIRFCPSRTAQYVVNRNN